MEEVYGEKGKNRLVSALAIHLATRQGKLSGKMAAGAPRHHGPTSEAEDDNNRTAEVQSAFAIQHSSGAYWKACST